MKKNNGFTLIELIAVITILSLIALVSVPVIINTMNRAKQKESDKFKQIVKNAAELYLERNRDLYSYFNEIGDSIDIDASTLISEGYLKGDLVDPVNNTNVSKYKVTVIYGQDEIFEYQTLKTMTFAELATTTDEITSINACALSGTCQVGTKFAIQVNENDVYNFYVIADDGKEVTLIMDRNLGDNVAWINAEDYDIANTDSTNCVYSSCTDEGPVTAINALDERTSNWTNILQKKYTYRDDGPSNLYEEFKIAMRARILNYTDIDTITTQNGGSMPNYLYINLSTSNTTEAPYGYWLSDALSSEFPRIVNHSGNTQDYYSHYSYLDGAYGIRPVITVLRSL